MSKKALLSWLTPNDPIVKKDGTFFKGPIITILENLKVDVAYLFYSALLEGSEYQILRMEEYLKKDFPALKVDFIPIFTTEINDYDFLYPLVKKAVLDILPEESNYQFFVHTSPGTQQMHTIWILLFLEGILEKATLIQTRLGYSKIIYLNETLKNIKENLQFRKKNATYFKVRSELEKIYQEELANLKRYFLEERDKFFLELAVSDKSYLQPPVLQRMLKSDHPILILGETGTGKTRLAHFLHKNLEQARGKSIPFVEVDCTGLSEELAYSQLFGHSKGAFTGAASERKGAVEYADGGILFLDEVGDLSLNLQSKLLKFLDLKWSQKRREYVNCFYRLGDYSLCREVKVKVILATNKDLSQEVQKGNFRPDLWNRVNIFEYKLLPLRERPKKELKELIENFWREITKKEGKVLSENLKQILMDHDYRRGNIRELKNILSYLAVISGNEKLVTLEHLPQSFYENISIAKNWRKLDFAEKQALYEKVKSISSSKKEQAKLLGISPTALYDFLKKLNSKD